MNDRLTEERNEIFDSAVREQLTGYEPTVPHALWNRIASELDGSDDELAADISVPAHHEIKGNNKWKMAIAAAVLLTLTVGGILYKLSPVNNTMHGSGAVATKVAPVTIQKTESIAPVKATPVRTVAQSTAAPAPSHTTILSEPVAKNNTKNISTATREENTTTANAIPVTNTQAQDQTTETQTLETAAVTTENRPLELGSIPSAALNFLPAATVNNDEITIIKSTEKKKKHAKTDEETKVIMIGKKFDSKPDIRYVLPMRF